MDLTRISAAELVKQLATRQVSATDVMRATLDRIAKVNGDVNAIVALREESALMAEAQRCDSGPITGPLHGLPIAVKDLVNVAGVVSSHGSPLFKDVVPDSDDLIAARMRDAGAILIGKTNTPEFGLGSHTFNPVYGATRNPYNADHTCGGSSGGAAVALATGMVALADGSDMMGSLRNPAAWNNVYGFRPSWGRVPSDPVGDSFLHQLSTLGPMARSPEDLGILLDVISGPDPRLPLASDSVPVSPVEIADLQGLRIGWLGDWGGAFPTEPGILDLCKDALTVFESLGADVQEVDPPFDAEQLWTSWITLRSFSVAAGLEPLASQRDHLKDTAQWELDRGLAMCAMEVQHVSVIRSDWFRRAADLFKQFDALVLPSAQVWPFGVEIPYPTSIAGRTMDTYHRWMHVTVPVSLIGLPCLAAPAGFGSNGLPMGFQLFGPRGADHKLLSVGAAYHAETNWPSKRPARP
ncbi:MULTISPECIES: amidase [unclassified Ruegeria]|uniref:amidase n=1 Tax=unclassified Ruegeria TaxID=2625375 RepID=UPI0014887A20|nr:MULTISPECIES: amidase [unclassified Ruegeria]NOD34170.1 amidase [Ruegeria sp. HKCCD7296]NOE41194.1 amidase [Ruegeria sp. HKCCD7319]